MLVPVLQSGSIIPEFIGPIDRSDPAPVRCPLRSADSLISHPSQSITRSGEIWSSPALATQFSIGTDGSRNLSCVHADVSKGILEIVATAERVEHVHDDFAKVLKRKRCRPGTAPSPLGKVFLVSGAVHRFFLNVFVLARNLSSARADRSAITRFFLHVRIAQYDRLQHRQVRVPKRGSRPSLNFSIAWFGLRP